MIHVLRERTTRNHKIDTDMNKTQKTLLVTAAVAGLFAGAAAKANADRNVQNQDVAGKQVSTNHTTPNACNGCSHTNSAATNGVATNSVAAS